MLSPSQPDHGLDLSAIKDQGLFVPVLPPFEKRKGGEDTKEKTLTTAEQSTTIVARAVSLSDLSLSLCDLSLSRSLECTFSRLISPKPSSFHENRHTHTHTHTHTYTHIHTHTHH
jgi:hypothetical protein